MDFDKVGKTELCEHECDTHALTQSRTLKGGWFGLTVATSLMGFFVTTFHVYNHL